MKIKINVLCIDKRTFATSSKEGLKNQDQGCSGKVNYLYRELDCGISQITFLQCGTHSIFTTSFQL